MFAESMSWAAGDDLSDAVLNPLNGLQLNGIFVRAATTQTSSQNYFLSMQFSPARSTVRTFIQIS